MSQDSLPRAQLSTVQGKHSPAPGLQVTLRHSKCPKGWGRGGIVGYSNLEVKVPALFHLGAY